jgi:phosphoribosylanthranilate isomerase
VQNIVRTRVKICGITRSDDGLAAAAAGADAIGLVFYPPSPRAVSVEQALDIVSVLPPFVTVTALFVDAARDKIRQVLDSVPVDLLQFHGSELPADCEGFGRPYIKALAMRDGVDLVAACRDFDSASGILVDAWHPQVPGGSGASFDWDRLPASLEKPLILAGGLTPDNVSDAVGRVQPWAVDVSSGVERAKGVKDPERIRQFIKGVQGE